MRGFRKYQGLNLQGMFKNEWSEDFLPQEGGKISLREGDLTSKKVGPPHGEVAMCILHGADKKHLFFTREVRRVQGGRRAEDMAL